MGYLLSIVVPTKNRYPYLKHLIQYIKSFDTDDLELVIQDNTAENAELVDFIKEKDYPHLKYYHTKESIPVGLNSDKAILNSTGEYVCLIGDDDGITPDLIEQIKQMKELGYDSMITRNATYNWPDYKDDSLFRLTGAMTVDKANGKNEDIDVQSELNRVSNTGFLNIGKLPKVYQAVVRRSVLDKIYEKCGTFFPGPSPDMANAIALTCFVNKVWYNDHPTIITGQCRSVGGGERLMDKLLPLNEIQHLPKDILTYWDEKLPNLWCSDTIWPGSASIAAKKMGIDVYMNYNQIYGRFMLSHPSYKSAIDEFQYNRVLVFYYKNKLYLKKISNAVLNRITYLMSGKKRIQQQSVYRDLKTIKEAGNTLMRL